MNTKITSCQSLLALLAQFSISPVTFDALRADAYEKHLAARSLTELEQFYTTLFDPALSYRQIQAASPPWDLKKYQGHRPSLETLREIRQRIRLEQTADQLAAFPALLTTLKNAAPALPDNHTSDLLNLIIALLGQELISAKLEGQPIMENFKVLDRLIKAEALRLRYPAQSPKPVEPETQQLTDLEWRWLERGKTEWLGAVMMGTTDSWFANPQSNPLRATPKPIEPLEETSATLPETAEPTPSPSPEPLMETPLPEPPPTQLNEQPHPLEPARPTPMPTVIKLPKPIYTPTKHSKN